jgi:hypothetical protein
MPQTPSLSNLIFAIVSWAPRQSQMLGKWTENTSQPLVWVATRSIFSTGLTLLPWNLPPKPHGSYHRFLIKLLSMCTRPFWNKLKIGLYTYIHIYTHLYIYVHRYIYIHIYIPPYHIPKKNPHEMVGFGTPPLGISRKPTFKTSAEGMNSAWRLWKISVQKESASAWRNGGLPCHAKKKQRNSETL